MEPSCGELIRTGHHILSVVGTVCNAVKNIGGVDRYVTLQWRDGVWLLISC